MSTTTQINTSCDRKYPSFRYLRPWTFNETIVNGPSCNDLLLTQAQKDRGLSFSTELSESRPGFPSFFTDFFIDYVFEIDGMNLI